MGDLIKRQTSLSAHIVTLSRFLRKKGFLITNSEEHDAMDALTHLPPFSEDMFVATLRAVLCKNQFQYEGFSDFYKEFQFQLSKAVDSKIKNQPTEDNQRRSTKKPSIEALKNWLYNKPNDDEVEVSSFSNIEVLTKKDFSLMSQDELDFIMRILQKMTTRILRKKGRLHKLSKSRKHLNLGMTLRQNLRSGTEINNVIFSERKEKKLKLVLLCDVSRSMDLYSRFFVQMIYAFQNGYDRVETFVFSTSLHRISEIMDNYPFDQALEIISDRIPEWSGGTKIGSCLESFCASFADKMLDKKTVVLILSDGWDTGESNLLKKAMKKIHRASRKVIWLNPLAGHPEFEPEVIGLKNVMPYIHKLYAAHNLESLREAMRKL